MLINSFIDIHTHGQFAYGDTENIISIKSLNVEELSEQVASGLVSAGVHPWWTLDYTTEEINTFKEKILSLCDQNLLFAVGETGLDRVYKETFEQQKELFSWHIDLAQARDLPLIIHSVRSGSDILEILKEKKPSNPWIFHDFRGNLELVHAILILHSNVYFSFGISLDNSQSIRELIRELKPETILFETDAQKHLDISDIYLRASEQLGMDELLLKSIVMKNFSRLCKKI